MGIVPMQSDMTFLAKRDTLIVAGLAVMLMVWHHLFLFQNWLAPGSEWHTIFGYPGRLFILSIANFGNICVQTFAFLSGYALYVNEKAFNSWRMRGKRLLKFLGGYWLVFGVFLLVGLIAGYRMPNTHMLVTNMFGINTSPCIWVNVPFAWYVCFYIEFIILSPLLIVLFKNRWSHWIVDIFILLSFLVFVLLIGKIDLEGGRGAMLKVLYPLISLIVGVLVAKYRIYDKLYKNIGKYCTLAVSIVACFGLILFRYMIVDKIDTSNLVGGGNSLIFNAFIAVAFIFFSLISIKKLNSKSVDYILIQLGVLSMFIWFIHGIFFIGDHPLQGFIYSVKEPILIFILCMVIVTPVAWVLNWIHSKIWERI